MNVKINEQALKEALNEKLASKALQIEDLEQECPSCGKTIAIKEASNTCDCGFVIEVQIQ